MLPGTGFILLPALYLAKPAITSQNKSKTKLSEPLLLSLAYLLLLFSLVLWVSWSGLIFSELGLTYLFLAYVTSSLLSTFHLAYKLSQSTAVFPSYMATNKTVNAVCGQSVGGIKTAFFIKTVQISIPVIYLALLLLLSVNKQSLLGWQVYNIPSASMSPTLHIGDVVLADTRPATVKSITNQDIIIFKYSSFSVLQKAYQKSQVPLPFYIKRVIASGGDTITIENHQLFVNNHVIKSNLTEQQRTKQVINENAFFVVGDNINQSSDSRAWGQLPVENVIGKFIRVVYRKKN